MSVKRNGGMLENLKVGLSEGGGERLSRGYAHNSFGDITALTEGADSYRFFKDGNATANLPVDDCAFGHETGRALQRR